VSAPVRSSAIMATSIEPTTEARVKSTIASL
jgi:hypothetical protein